MPNPASPDFRFESDILHAIRHESLARLQDVIENSDMTIPRDTLSMWLAAQIGNLDMVKYLEAKGVDIHGYDDSALITAVEHNGHNVVDYLLQKNANIRTHNNAPIIKALQAENWDMVEKLVKKDKAVLEAAQQKCTDLLERLNTYT